MQYKMVALIMAGGIGARVDGNLPKQYLQVRGRSILTRVLEKFLNHPQINSVLVVINEQHDSLYEEATKDLNALPPAIGGERRQDSVRNGLIALEKYSPERVLIHDAARMLTTTSQISRVVEELNNYDAVTLGARVVDSLRYDGDNKGRDVSRDNLFSIQTPQGFKYPAILKWHNELKDQSFTDDISIAEAAGCKNIRIIESSLENFKITNKDDLRLAERLI